MKTTKLIISVFASLFLLTPAFAQAAAVRVTVPFDFSVGDQRLPGGEYRVVILNDSALQMVRINGSSVATSMITHIGGSKLDQTPRVVFHCYASKCFLAEAWMGEVSVGHQLFASGEELEYARNAKQERKVLVASR